jgi:hypothetical protein
MGDPVSWAVIEPGWVVVAANGEELGKVHEVLGDTGIDIFNGLAVSPGRLRHSRYVPAELVGRIEEGRVEIDIDQDTFDRLGEHGEVPPQSHVRPDTTDL